MQSYDGGTILSMDVWPLVAEITDSDFLQGEALAIQHAHFGWLPPAGPEVRSGVSSFTATNTHHEGGFSSAGVFSLGVGSYLRVDGCLLYTSPSPRDKRQSRMPSSA